jgi:hypothetical protein
MSDNTGVIQHSEATIAANKPAPALLLLNFELFMVQLFLVS